MSLDAAFLLLPHLAAVPDCGKPVPDALVAGGNPCGSVVRLAALVAAAAQAAAAAALAGVPLMRAAVAAGAGTSPAARAPDPLAAIRSAIGRALARANPRFDPTRSAYSENCTGVVHAYELQRRGQDVAAGPLEPWLRTDQGGPGGRSPGVVSGPWGRQWSAASGRADIEQAFAAPGSRGVVYIAWYTGGAHVFNVENVNGTVLFVDAQPTPAVADASNYFNLGSGLEYVRLDDLPIPPSGAIAPYLEQTP